MFDQMFAIVTKELAKLRAENARQAETIARLREALEYTIAHIDNDCLSSARRTADEALKEPK